MLKTKTKKILALVSVFAMAGTTFMTTYAATNIGTAGVTGTGAFDSNVVWDDTFPGTATGTVSGITVTAQVLPTLNMSLSASSVDLGTLLAGTTSSGTIDIEVGTNAANGVSITATSSSGWLTNTSDNALQINNLTTDGIAESYTFESTANAIDSTISGFTTTGDLASTEVNDTTSHTIYTTNKPERLDNTVADLTFKVSATSDAQTAAWNYQDTITFTVTWNF